MQHHPSGHMAQAKPQPKLHICSTTFKDYPFWSAVSLFIGMYSNWKQPLFRQWWRQISFACSHPPKQVCTGQESGSHYLSTPIGTSTDLLITPFSLHLWRHEIRGDWLALFPQHSMQLLAGQSFLRYEVDNNYLPVSLFFSSCIFCITSDFIVIFFGLECCVFWAVGFALLWMRQQGRTLLLNLLFRVPSLFPMTFSQFVSTSPKQTLNQGLRISMYCSSTISIFSHTKKKSSSYELFWSNFQPWSCRNEYQIF